MKYEKAIITALHSICYALRNVEIVTGKAYQINSNLESAMNDLNNAKKDLLVDEKNRIVETKQD